MRIYEAEKQAGINFEDHAASAFVTAQVKIGDIKEHFDGMSVADLMEATDTVQTVEQLLGQKQPDLALVVSILVSTGWNRNDDIFTPEEVWAARKSPLHKPMNDNHDITKIYGHIVQTRALDKEGNEIELAENESPPSEFDLEVAGVLYKQFDELRDRVDDIIEKSNAGEMFVSMEAWFPDFGYGLTNEKTGVTKLIDRTEATAFLTKHLRIFGGSGEYQGFKVGRVLKDMIFGAQAFVDGGKKPANPDSVIKVAATKVAASSDFVAANLNDLLEGGVEDVDEKELKVLQDKLEDTVSSLATKNQEVTDLQKAAEEFKANDFEGQIAALNTKVEELTASSTEVSEKVTAMETDKSEIAEKLTAETKRADKAVAELDEIRKTETARDRMAKLCEVKEVKDEEATLAELRDMTDEIFDTVLKYAGEAKVEATEPTESKEKTGDENAETNEATAALDDVVNNTEAELNASADAAQTEADGWASTAAGLCGQKTSEEGGE